MTLTEDPYNLPQMLVDERLSTHHLQSYVAEVSRIRLHAELDEVAFDIDIAIPCGLVLDELRTNAVKYASPAAVLGTLTLGPEKANASLCVCMTPASVSGTRSPSGSR